MRIRQAGIDYRLIGGDHNDVRRLPRDISALRRIGIGTVIGPAHAIVAKRIARPERRRRFIHRRAGRGLLHRAVRTVRTSRIATHRPAGRAEPVQRCLPPGGVVTRRLALGNGFIAHHGGRTRARLQHRITEQVERAFVARRIAGRRIARPRGSARRGIAGSRG